MRLAHVLKTLAFVALITISYPLSAQYFSALARIDMSKSQIVDTRDGIEVELALSQVVPYRVFILDAPRRLIVDFREVDWSGASRAALLNADGAADLRFGGFRPGWSRLVIDLASPLTVQQAGMRVDTATGAAVLTVQMTATNAEQFAAAAGAPDDPVWGALETQVPAVEPDISGALVVVIDPGHGGIDPGAQRGGIKEADLMLTLAREVEDALRRSGQVIPVLTREADVFVPLQARITHAHRVGADLFISLHADALSEGQATGATVYTLSEEASDFASEQMAERLGRDDLLAGVDLSGQDDRIATALMELARLETEPRTQRLGAALIAGLEAQGARMNSRPLRFAEIAVLKSADIPSVLIEVGFMSNDQDLADLQNEEVRKRIVAGILQGVLLWSIEDAEFAKRVRQ